MKLVLEWIEVVERISVCLCRKIISFLDFFFQIDQTYMNTTSVIQRSMHFVPKPRKYSIFVRKKIHFPSLIKQNVPVIAQIGIKNINKKSQLNFLYMYISLKSLFKLFLLFTFYLG